MVVVLNPPTVEQQAVVDAFRTGDDLVIEAGAGTGKTTTLEMVAAAQPNRRGVYVAYNRATADDAGLRFPSSVKCSTAHSLAFGSVGRRFAHRLNGPRLPASAAAEILSLPPLQAGGVADWLPPTRVARIVLETVERFCHSADSTIRVKHVPVVLGLTQPEQRGYLCDAIPPLAERAWHDLTRADGRLKYTHDTYLKLWQLSRPRLPYDYVLLDESQDANPAIAAIVESQEHAQRVLVGDRNQSLYQWRGAIDAMTGFAGRRLVLSQSFRFGEAIAEEANKWLRLLDAPLRLRGFEGINSATESLAEPDVVLCRTNAVAVTRVIAAQQAGRRAALVGGGEGIRHLAQAAITLKAGLGTDHPELFAFKTWGQLQEYVDHDLAGADLRPFVRLIDSRGPEAIIAAVDRLVAEQYAEVVISTAHKAKGREWGTVQIANDFREPKATEEDPKPEISEPDKMLAYVSVTRARFVLDREGLAWVDGWLGSAPDERVAPSLRASR